MAVVFLVLVVLLHAAPPALAADGLLSRSAGWRPPLAHGVHEGVKAAPESPLVEAAPESPPEGQPRFRAFLDALSAGIGDAEAAIKQREDVLAEMLESRAQEDPNPDPDTDTERDREVVSGEDSPDEDELKEDDRAARRAAREEEAEEEVEEPEEDGHGHGGRHGGKHRGGHHGSGGPGEETSVDDEGPSKEELAEKGASSTTMPVNQKWFTFWYWKPLLASIAWMTVMIDVVAPFYNTFCPFTLISEAIMMSTAIFGFTAVVFTTMAPGAAGVTILMANATLSSTLSLLMLLLAVSLWARKTAHDDPAMQLSTDLAKLYRPILRLMQVCVILQVITHEAKVDWSQLAVIMTFMMLGIALSLTGVISDIMAHIFIRLDNHFKEGDYIVWDDDLVQIERLEWRHTVGITDSTNAYIYIPNSQLTSDSLINQCEDNERKVEIDIPVEAEADDIQQCVRNCWEILAQIYAKDFTFTGSDGETYDNQLEISQCAVWLKEDCMTIRVTLYGRYFYSEPPTWDDAEQPEPPMEERHFDWERGWYMQVEWFNLEVKRWNEAVLKDKDAHWPAQDPRQTTWK